MPSARMGPSASSITARWLVPNLQPLRWRQCWMIERSEKLCFAPEAHHALGVSRERSRQDLGCNISFEPHPDKVPQQAACGCSEKRLAKLMDAGAQSRSGWIGERCRQASFALV
jgi:hypothetical protein